MKKVAVNLKLINKNEIAVAVQCKIKRQNGTVIRNERKLIPSARIKQGFALKPQTATVIKTKVPKKSTIYLEYGPAGTRGSHQLEPINVGNSPSLPWTDEVRSFDTVKNDGTNLTELRAFAQTFGSPKAKVSKPRRLLDIEEQLGAALIYKVDGRQVSFVDLLKFVQKPELKAGKTDTVEDLREVNGSFGLSLNLSIPVYGAVSSSMSEGHVYSLMSKVVHYPATNNFEFVKALHEAANNDETKKGLEVLKSQLELDEKHQVFIIRDLHVIESAIFSLTKGTETEIKGDAAVASVFTASGAYTFSRTDQELYALSDRVININFAEIPRKQMLALVNKLLGEPSRGSDDDDKPTPVEVDEELSADLAGAMDADG